MTFDENFERRKHRNGEIKKGSATDQSYRTKQHTSMLFSILTGFYEICKSLLEMQGQM